MAAADEADESLGDVREAHEQAVREAGFRWADGPAAPLPCYPPGWASRRSGFRMQADDGSGREE